MSSELLAFRLIRMGDLVNKTFEQTIEETIDEKIGLELIKTALKKQKKIRLTFRGKSMEPSIKDGEKVFFEKVSPDQIRTGDIILFDRAGSLIGHRVLWKVEFKKIYFLTKGDNSNFSDRPIHVDTVYARVIHSKNKVTVQKSYFRTKVVFLLEILLSKIENALLRDFKIFRGSISRTFRNLIRIFY